MPKVRHSKFEYIDDLGITRMIYLDPSAIFMDIGRIDRKLDDE